MHRSFSLPAQARSLSRQVVDVIGQKIVAGALPSGDTLPNEDELAASLQVSRTVIREAVKILADKRLVEVRTRVGTRVRPGTEWNLLDADVLRWQYESGPTRAFLHNVVEVRRAIEVAASELAALRATDADIAPIRACYEHLASSVQDDDAYIEADLTFHESIFRACHNELLMQLALTLRVALQSSRKITVQIPGGSLAALPLHFAVVDAIGRHDVQAAAAATHKLIDRSVYDIELILSHKKP
ncbi:MAG: FadR family transcriptional regulator [Anaerolineae bacterium]|nr:FadR family transcriptional regulator [Anaerolineae bacterium]